MKYAYRAVNADGGYVTGTLEADTPRAAARVLRRQGLNVVDVKDARESSGRRPSARGKKPGKQDVLIFMHQFATLLAAGIPLEETVDSLAESTGYPFISQEFGDIATALRRGEIFSQALKNCKLKLPGYFYPLAEAGELTGRLAQAIKDAVTQWEYDLQTLNELRDALTYPFILVISGIGAVLLIFTLVVPKFVNLLEKSRGEVPLLARIVLGAGQLVNENMMFVGMILAAVIALMAYLISNQEMRRQGRNFLARMPFFKSWLMESDIGRWSTMMATLLENRVSLLQSLDLAQRYVTIDSLGARLLHVTRSVRGGISLADSLQESGAITVTGYNLIRVGERSGELPRMLRSLSMLYTESVRNRVKRTLVLVEPAAIIIIGAMVGLIMAGIILAITSVNNVAV